MYKVSQLSFVLVVASLGSSVQASQKDNCLNYEQFCQASEKAQTQFGTKCTDGKSCFSFWKKEVKKALGVSKNESLPHAMINQADKSCLKWWLPGFLNDFDTTKKGALDRLKQANKMASLDLKDCQSYLNETEAERKECEMHAITGYVNAYQHFARTLSNAAQECELLQ